MNDKAVPPAGLARKTREEVVEQASLFDVAPSWADHWWGMPSFTQGNALPAHRVTVNFMCFEDVERFASLLGVTLTRRTDSMWFPQERIDEPSEWEYGDES